ncbi:MAG TPA: extracellular solute-binding protein [Actinomycetota bacterium]|nr:extracellular solute-binding protein [Actinomycetota bacterium]
MNHELERLLDQTRARRYSRRDVLKRAGAGAGAVSLSALLAACGIGGEQAPPSGGGEGSGSGFTTDEITGELNFANWPAYIDKAKGKSPTLEEFGKTTDIEVKYAEVINDNVSFFSTIREPLANGQPVEWDLIVVTDWLISKMARLGYLEELDHSKLGNFEANAAEIYKDPSFDPGNTHSIPWQSGITGIAYNPELTGREISSVNDLFDPKFKGHVGMFSEMRDTMNLILLGNGVTPEDATIEDVEAAQKLLLDQREKEIVRSYYGNDYVQPLNNGDLWLTIAWSGDVLGKTLGADSKIKFVVPDEGGIIWVDNLAIPQNAANPIDAHELMNFVYQPEIAAQMTAWINYISPVPAAQEILQKADDSYTRQVANSPLVFPTSDMESRLHYYKNLSEEEEAEWNELFDEVVQG